MKRRHRGLNRREFLGRSAGAGMAAVGYYAGTSRAAESKSPNEKLNIAAVGATGRAGANIEGVSSQSIVAIADIDANLLGKGAQPYPQARKYRDFRVMLEKESDRIDAVLVGTADHTHAPAAAMAMRLNKHVYCEKPLTHTVYEARKLAQLAQQNNLVTQMGTQIHAGDNYRRVVELVESGTIGPVREAHVWVSVDYQGRKLTTGTQSPNHVDWDLWQGPAAERAYSDGVHPYHWRWFWDYGSGGLGDFGCHYMDLAHWALRLQHPTSISATGPEVHPESTTSGIVVEYQYPARDTLPPVKLTWYDGGKRPEILSTLADANGNPLDWKSGQLFVGESGMVLSDYGKHRVFPADRTAEVQRPEPYIPKSIGHHNEWVHAIKTGGPTTCNFAYSGALTEAVLLGVASYRSGSKIEWDAENLTVKNSSHAQQFIHKEYRKGWVL